MRYVHSLSLGKVAVSRLFLSICGINISPNLSCIRKKSKKYSVSPLISHCILIISTFSSSIFSFSIFSSPIFFISTFLASTVFFSMFSSFYFFLYFPLSTFSFSTFSSKTLFFVELLSYQCFFLKIFDETD